MVGIAVYSLAILSTAQTVGAAGKKEEWVAKINNKKITVNAVKKYREHLINSGSDSSTLDLQKLAVALIHEEALVQEGIKKGFAKGKNYRYELEVAKRKLIITRLVKDYLSKNQPSTAEIDSAYQQYSKDKYEYDVRHILLDDPIKAKNILKQIRRGESFSELAKSNSLDSSAKNGGRLGWATPSIFVEEFKEALLDLDENETTKKPVKSSFGWHIVQNLGKRKREILPFNKIKPRLINEINQSKVNEYSQVVVKKANIQLPPQPKKK